MQPDPAAQRTAVLHALLVTFLWSTSWVLIKLGLQNIPALTFAGLRNHTLRTLSATESTILNSTMLAQIPVLAWVFLGETLTVQQIGGMALAGLGALLAQWRASPP